MADFIPIKDDGNIFKRMTSADDLKIGSGVIKTGTRSIDIANVGISETEWFTYDGSNNVFTLSYTPIKIILVVYNKAEHLEPNVDYTVNSNNVTIDVNQVGMVSDDKIMIYYER